MVNCYSNSNNLVGSESYCNRVVGNRQYVDRAFHGIGVRCFRQPEVAGKIERKCTSGGSSRLLKESDDYIKMVGNKIVEFHYQTRPERTYHVNAGIYLMEPAIFQRIPEKGSLEKTVLPGLSRKGDLTAFIFSGKWMHVK